jgi:hypothetical protein
VNRRLAIAILALLPAVVIRQLVVDYRHHPPPGPVRWFGLARRVELRRDTTLVCADWATLKAHEEDWDGRIYAIAGCHTLDRADYRRADLLVNTYTYARVRFTLADGRKVEYWVPRRALVAAGGLP